MSFNRRDFIKFGSLASLPLLGTSRQVAAMAKAAKAGNAPAFPARKMLTIYLRGGNDALNAIAPLQDPEYTARRPNIGLSFTGPRIALPVPDYPDLGIHNKLANLRNLMTSAQGRRVAALHRVGNFDGQRSHFTEQHLSETGILSYGANNEGWIPQMLPDLGSSALMPAVSESNRLMRMYLASAPNKAATHLQGVYSSGAIRNVAVPFASSAEGQRVADQVAAVTDASVSPPYPTVGEATYLRSNLDKGIGTLNTLRSSPSITHDDVKYPSLNAANEVHPNTLGKHAKFFERLEESVAFMVRDQASVVGIELGGWDTHGNQVATHNELFSVLDRAIQSAYDDLNANLIANPGEEFLILVMTEFGRTVADNGPTIPPVSPGAGTDHGVGGMYLAIGSTVNGGVYNCSHPTWQQTAGTPTGNKDWDFLSTTPTTGPLTNALVPVTDFRVPFVEIAQNFFGFTGPQIRAFDSVGAEWNDILLNQATQSKQFLGFV